MKTLLLLLALLPCVVMGQTKAPNLTEEYYGNTLVNVENVRPDGWRKANELNTYPDFIIQRSTGDTLDREDLPSGESLFSGYYKDFISKPAYRYVKRKDKPVVIMQSQYNAIFKRLEILETRIKFLENYRADKADNKKRKKT